ncbi:MAG: single-stranded-DNA-specific exonuclease RecJ [Clostridia bacterium]|nr:single-stranded-DNA-specific exonuclease RecJ [Clostridia bacterium]
MLKLIPRETNAPYFQKPDDIDDILYSLLRLRGISSAEEAHRFLHPSREQLRDPFLLSDMQKAVDAIQSAVKNGDSICVYGDYDVDGVCASAILVSYLKSLGAKAEPYLPSRHHEGYGLNENAVSAISEKYRLLVTVDCGITACALVEHAKKCGLTVVVTDHHRPEGELPDCPVVNPLLNSYPFPSLCGAGVAFQLVSALGGRDSAMEYIDFAALATIADIVPLIDENRAIAHLGLKKINASPRPGVRALIDAAGLSGRPLSAGNIAFQLTPRLNASGRIGDAMRAYNLITGTDIDACYLLAGELNEENTRRKTLEQTAIDEAEAMIRDFDFTEHRAIIVAGDNWNAGVIGLAASRLTEKYRYPSIVLTLEDGVYVGSCRSIEEIDIHDALTNVSEHLVQFGGHKMAAGLRILPEKLEAFQSALDAYLFREIPPEAYIPKMEYDLEIASDSLTPESVYALEALAPTGCGNPAPVFRMKCDISSARAVGANSQHLKLTLKNAGTYMDGIWFRKGELASSLPKKADVLFAASVSSYQGRTSVQAEIRALAPVPATDRLTEAVTRTCALFQSFLTDAVYNNRYSFGETRALSKGALTDIAANSVQGVLIVAASAEGAQKALSLIESSEDIPFDVTIGEYPLDARAFRAIAVAPTGECPPFYKTVILADIPDGLVDAAFHIQSVAPCRLFRHMPETEPLRRIYQSARRVAKRPYFFSSKSALIRALSDEADLSECAVHAGLMILDDMDLMHINDKKDGARIEIPEMVKKNPEDNPLYNRLVAFKHLAEEGGGADE